MSSPATAVDRESSPGPVHPRPIHTVVVTTVLVLLYLAALWFTFTEAHGRSVKLEIQPQGADYLLVHADVINVDLLRSEMTARISFKLAGTLAQDESTPAFDLHLLLNAVRGQQEFDFPK